MRPDKDTVAAGSYPLSPAITLYFDHAPKKPIAPLVRDYLALALSDEGQAIIARFAPGEDGFLPLGPSDLRVEREKLKE
jgi:phosphate transport system substrate-binding protein